MPDDQLMTQTLGVAQQLAAGPTLAYGEAKRLVADSLSNTPGTQMEMETRAIPKTRATLSTAFTKKQRPEFKDR